MPRRLEVGLAALAAALVAAWMVGGALARPGEALPGGWAIWGSAWGMARVEWALSGLDAPAVDGPVVLAGWPQLLLGASLRGALGPALAATAAVWASLAAGVLAGWLAARSLGARPLPAALGALVVGLNPALVGAAHAGWLEWLAAPFVVAAFWGAAHPAEGRAGLLRGALGGLGGALAAACTPALGLTTALLACWIALARGGARVAAVGLPSLAAALAASWPHRGGTALARPMVEKIVAYVDPIDLLHPLWTWRDWGVHAGLALPLGLGAWAWLARRREGALPAALGGAAALGVLLSFGPWLQWGGARVELAGARVPLPALLLELPLAGGVLVNWKVALVPALAAAGLLLSRLPARLAAPAVLALGLELALAGPAPTVDGRVPEGVAQLAGGEGVVLTLPMELAAAPGDEGLALKALYWQGVHRRPLLTGMAASWRTRLFNEPVLILAANAQVGEDRWAIPQAGPVSALRELGVRALVVDRAALDVDRLAVLDRLLARALESPQRDLAGRVDLYEVPPAEGQRLPVEALELQPLSGAPPGWIAPKDYIARWR